MLRGDYIFKDSYYIATKKYAIDDYLKIKQYGKMLLS